MDVKILGWEYKGIRGANNLSLSFEHSQESYYPITLIMMPNGGGKTTTMELLRAIFHGEAEKWTEEQVKSFRPTDVNIDHGEFMCKLLFDNKVWYIYLELDYKQGHAYYKHSRVGEHGGMEIGHRLPGTLKHVFDQPFVNLFVFDGELVKEMLHKESDEAEKAISFLYQLNRLNDLSADISDLVTEAQENATKTKTKTEQGVRMLRSQKASCEASLKQLQKELNDKNEELDRKTARNEEVSTIISEAMRNNDAISEQVAQIEKDIELKRTEIKDKTKALLFELRKPYLLNNESFRRLNSLSGKMQQLKLPRTWAKQFFEELADYSECVCGRAISHSEKEHILEQADNYLDYDQISVLNSIKQATKGISYSKEIIDLNQEVKKLVGAYYELRGQHSSLKQESIESGRKELQDLDNEAKELSHEINQLNDMIETLSTKDSDKLWRLREDENIHLCAKKLQEIHDRLAEATNTVAFFKRAEQARLYLDSIRIETLGRLKNKIKNETNLKIKKIITSEPVAIEKIDRYIHIRDKDGVSQGQSLAIGYSFLGSIFEASSHRLPFVVDSPAGALDISIRREVAKILPELFDQLIIFMTSGERDGFAAPFYDRGDDVQYLTVNRIAGNGALSAVGLEEFKQFQSDKEEV